MSILERIVEHKRQEVAARKELAPLSDVKQAAESAQPARRFHDALVDSRRPRPRVIAEIKRRSPSKGSLRPDLDPHAFASLYESNGAAAISVLADNRFFGGSLDDLTTARSATSLPVLCKEFIVDPYQIYEARAAGADAILLIASVLDIAQLRRFRWHAASLGMAALVEVHDETELFSALASGAEIVGINNRDLHTFTVSLETTASLLSLVPAGVVTVSESGIQSAADRQRMTDLGVDAVLVGEGLIAAPDPASATREICGLKQALETST